MNSSIQSASLLISWNIVQITCSNKPSPNYVKIILIAKKLGHQLKGLLLMVSVYLLKDVLNNNSNNTFKVFKNIFLQWLMTKMLYLKTILKQLKSLLGPSGNYLFSKLNKNLSLNFYHYYHYRLNQNNAKVATNFF